MNLHDQLAHDLDRVDRTGPDVARLVAVSRRRGTRLRRRRTAALGVAAGVTALALTGGVLGAVSAVSGPGTGDTSVAAGTTQSQPTVVTPDLGGPTAPTTGEGAVLALQWAVDQQRAGSASELAGQLSSSDGDYYVELRWQDADGLGDSPVGLNVQHGRGMYSGCAHVELPCHETRLADGSRMTTYEERTTVPGGVGRRQVVDLFRTDRTRVVVSSTNGFERAGQAHWDLTRTAPPLTTADLEAIVRQPMWGDTLPVAFVEAGHDLPAYTDLDAQGGWVHGDVEQHADGTATLRPSSR